MAGNVIATALLVFLLTYRVLPWWLWLLPAVVALGVSRWGGVFWRYFFTDRLLPLGLLGLTLGLMFAVCQLDPLWLQVFWLGVGGGLLGLGLALPPSTTAWETVGDVITPDPAFQQPVRVSRLLTVVWGWLVWSLAVIPLSWRAPLAVLFTTVGLAGVGNWRVEVAGKELKIEFAGIIHSCYRFNLDRFQRLLLIKLQEGGVAWLQLANPSQEVTLPIILLETAANQGEMPDILSQRYPFARQVTTRDSLQMMGILLPQGTGILAGLGCLLLGTVLWWTIDVSNTEPPVLTWLLGGSLLLSPLLASWLFLVIVPGSIPPQSPSGLPPWELGLLLILINVISQPDPLLLVAIVFLVWGVGIYLLQLVRLIPIETGIA
ncbi:MAG: hypothetical protein ACK421_00330 [Pseudanabaenaceae cyanobacterium]